MKRARARLSAAETLAPAPGALFVAGTYGVLDATEAFVDYKSSWGEDTVLIEGFKGF